MRFALGVGGNAENTFSLCFFSSADGAFLSVVNIEAQVAVSICLALRKARVDLKLS